MAPPSLIRARWWGRSWIQDPLSLYINVDKKKSVKNPAKNKIKHLQSASPVHADRCRK